MRTLTGRIRVLPEDVARQIAAGEVVERPASVVKELLENALDAGATRVSLRVAGAGLKLIEVNDNGSGMVPDDVRLASRSFSTSKILKPNDLFDIRTYGFRGEALASISAVSRFEVISSPNASGEGWRYGIEGKQVTADEPAAHEKGTTVRVCDLFFNTPARKKFLKTDLTERKQILQAVLAVALIRPDVEIHYRDDDRQVLDLVADTGWHDRVSTILGGTSMEHMVEVNSENGPMRLGGFVSLPAHTRGNRSHQYFYVNRRMVKERTLIQALNEAYRTIIPYRRFPVVVLSLEVPCDQVDVNVHPSKLEVRLTTPRRIFDFVRRGIKHALSPHTESVLRVSYAPDWPDSQSALQEKPQPIVEVAPRPATAEGEGYRTRVRSAYSSFMEGNAKLYEFNPQLSLRPGSQTEKEEEIEQPDSEPIKPKFLTEEGLFWQFNNSYIFIQVRGGIVVIDQHAAHERIIFDTSQRRLQNEIPLSQQILFPINMELSLAELDVYRTSKDVFYKLGFHLEPFGGKSILVRGYPQGVKNWEEGRLLRQIFDDILQDRAPGKSHADRIIASFACRSAVRAGQKLSVEEMRMLADQLFAVPNPHSCPHGRPTIRRLSLEEIEGWFHRR